MNCILTKYICAKFGEGSFNSFRVKFNVVVQRDDRMAGRTDGRTFLVYVVTIFSGPIRATVTNFGMMVDQG